MKEPKLQVFKTKFYRFGACSVLADYYSIVHELKYDIVLERIHVDYNKSNMTAVLLNNQ